MGFFDDYTAAVESYPAQHMELEIVDISFVDGSNALNEGEAGGFRIKLINNGPLHVREGQFKVRGLNGMKVKPNGAGAPYVSEFVTSIGQLDTVGGHGGTSTSNGSPFGFLAPSHRQSVRDLIEVTLEDWRADLEHIHDNHSRKEPTVRATYRDRVRAE
jgi:hypothetical protein